MSKAYSNRYPSYKLAYLAKMHERIIELNKNGVPNNAIALRMGIKVNAVVRVLHKHGLKNAALIAGSQEGSVCGHMSELGKNPFRAKGGFRAPEGWLGD